MRNFIIFLTLCVSTSFFTGCVGFAIAGAGYVADQGIQYAKGPDDTCRCNYITRSAFGGFDIVEAIETSRITKGQDQYFTQVNNSFYYFASQKNKDAFEKDRDYYLSRFAFLGNDPFSLPDVVCNAIKSHTIFIDGESAESRLVFVFKNEKDKSTYINNKATLMPAWKVYWKSVIKHTSFYPEPTQRKETKKEEQKSETDDEPSSEEVPEKK